MATTTQTAETSDLLQGTMTFAVDIGVKPATYIDPTPDQMASNTGEFEDRVVGLHDARPLASELSLDKQGYILLDRATGCQNFLDEDHLTSVYYPECIELVKEFTGATRVEIFDHTIRVEDETFREKNGLRAPVQVMHNDYTDWSAPKRIRDLWPDKADALIAKRFIMVNVWRPLMGPIRSFPLVLCDASTMQNGDLLAADHIYSDRRGETYRVCHSDAQRWHYFSEMGQDEAVLIKCYDSLQDGRAKLSGHGAARLVDSPPDAIPRQSIEVRTIGFFDD